MFNLTGDYGNAFIENAPYTNKFAQYHFNFWQYTDFYSYWHGTATAYTPQSYYDETAQKDWTQKWFEFGFLNIPNPTYTDAAHKNGVMSLAGIFFSNSDRGQQTYKQMLVKDENGKYAVAEKMVEMAKYYGFDGYFFNQEESGPNVNAGDIADYIAFLKVFQKAGLYVQWYDAVDTNSGATNYFRDFNDNNISWLYDRSTKEPVTNSFFFDYGVSSYQVNNINNYLTNLNSTYGTNYNIFDVGFAGLEAGRDRFNNSLNGKIDANGLPTVSIATLGSDFVHAGLDEDMGKGYPTSNRSDNNYQWMTTMRERLWWSGPNQNPKNTNVASTNSVDDVYANNTSWTGIASAIAERSVISGNNFYTNFNTGHGLSYNVNGSVSGNDEWSNMSLQDIPVTWQWWQDTTGSAITVDFDYGSKYTMTGDTKNRFTYQKIGAYNGGSSLVVNGNLDAEDFLHLYKTELNVNANSKLSITYNKPTADDASSMSVGIIFKDAPTDVVKVPVANSGNKTSGWVSSELDLSAYAGKTIAAFGLVFDNGGTTINGYQMNIGQIRIFDGSAVKPSAPAGLKIDNAFTNTNEMNLSWNMDSDYSKVKQYNIYVNDIYVGGKYDSIFYIKKLPAKSGTIKLVAVGADGLEGDAATLSFDLEKTVSQIKTDSKADGTLNVSWANPANATGDIVVKVKSVNLPSNKVISKETTVSEGSTEVTFTGMPVNGDDYIVEITAGTNNAVSISGNFIDKVCEPYSEAWSWDGDTLNLPMPNTRDWHYMYVYEDGVAKSFNTTYNQGSKPMIIRGRTTKDCLKFTSTAKKVSVVMEDYAGNKSTPLILKGTIPPTDTNLQLTVIGASDNGGTNETKEKALDGDETTKWCVGNAKTGWLAVDLGKTYEVNSWKTIHGEKGDKDPGFNTKIFALEVLKDKNATEEQLKDSSYLADSANWTEVELVDNSTDKAMVVDHKLGTTATGRYFRLRIDDSCINQYTAIRIHEFQLYGRLPDTAAPQEVTGAKISAGDEKLKITWIDPEDDDFDHIVITGKDITTQNITKGTQTATITGLKNGTEYTFTLMTVDAKGNTSSGISLKGTPKVPSPSDTCVSTNAVIIGASGNGNYGEEKQKALDGDELTKWCDGSKTGWLAIDLGKDYEISRWRTVHGEKGDKDPGFNTKKFALEVLKNPNATEEQLKDSTYLGNNANWTQVEFIDNSTAKAMVVDNMLGTSVSGRYFRLRIDDSCINQYTAVRIHEFQLYGVVSGGNDTTAPAEVTGLKVAADDGKLVLTWINPTDADFDHVVVAGASIPSENITVGNQTATITGLTNGTAYTVKVQTADTSGNVSAGAEVSGTPEKKDTTAPAEVAGLKATAGNGQLVLTWTNPADADFDHVVVTGAAITLSNITMGNQTATITGLTNGTAYTVRVQTVDTTGNVSAGAEVSGTPEEKDTTAPAEVTVLKAAAGNGQLVLTWTNPADADFDHVVVTGAAITFSNITMGNQTATITGLTNGTEYTIKVQTVDVSGNVSAGAKVKGTPIAQSSYEYKPPVTPAPVTTVVQPGLQISNGVIKVQQPQLNTATGEAKAAAISSDDFSKVLSDAKTENGVKKVYIDVPKVDGAKSYAMELPKTALASEDNTKVQIKTDFGTLTVPSGMLNSTNITASDKIEIVVAKTDNTGIAADSQTQIQGRPVVDISIRVNGKTVAWSDHERPVTVKIPYNATKEELENYNYITVLYLSDDGKAVSVPNARYNESEKVVEFRTTHLSKYAVAFVKKTFADIKETSKMKESIDVLASKGIIEGTTDTLFSPDKSITRGDFLKWLVKTLDLTAKYDTNFTDINSTDAYYNEIGIAKALGITYGTGDNKFNPEKLISRQDMMVLTKKALVIADRSLTAGRAEDLSRFSDAAKVSKYAVESVAAMVKSAYISGSGDKLNPTATTTRAEAAQMLYVLLKK
jgi:endo-beta-N-acetylglucosaminidase D/chitodextrinase